MDVPKVLYQSPLIESYVARCERKVCTSIRDDRSLEKIVGKRPFKSVKDLHKEWTEAGVSASRPATQTQILDM